MTASIFPCNSACTASKESWTKWNQTTSTDGNQYIKKGYRHYDLTLPDGTIIARNIYGEELKEKLKEIFPDNK